jgi:hypothetical protein
MDADGRRWTPINADKINPKQTSRKRKAMAQYVFQYLFWILFAALRLCVENFSCTFVKP